MISTTQYSTSLIQWHSGFYGAISCEFRDEKDSLTFTIGPEVTKAPLQLDLVICKNPEAMIQNDLGKIFRTYNFFEYKGVGGDLGVDAYFKTIAYACLYDYKGAFPSLDVLCPDGNSPKIGAEGPACCTNRTKAI